MSGSSQGREARYLALDLMNTLRNFELSAEIGGAGVWGRCPPAHVRMHAGERGLPRDGLGAKKYMTVSMKPEHLGAWGVGTIRRP